MPQDKDDKIIVGQCPLCEWCARQGVGGKDRVVMESYVAKALMEHLRLKHARHDEVKVENTNIAISTILSSRTKQGMIEFSLNKEITQWELDKAREIHSMLGHAIEAAVSDTIVYRFFTEKFGLDNEKASMILLEFRELRQGSKDIIWNKQ